MSAFERRAARKPLVHEPPEKKDIAARRVVPSALQRRENVMAKGEQKGNRESKKSKKEKVKTIAAAPSQKGAAAGWQPKFGSGKKK
jgi:hypothetical protein